MITDNKNNTQFIKNSVWTVITKFVLVVFKMGISVVTARFLGPMGRGIFYAVIQTAGTIGTLGTLSMGESSIYFIGHKRIPTQNVMGTTTVLIILCSSISCGILLCLQSFVQESIFKDVSPDLFKFVYMLIPLLFSEYFIYLSLRGLKCFKVVNVLTIATRSILLAFILFAMIGINSGVHTALIAYISAKVLTIVIMAIILFDKSARKWGVSWRMILPSMKYGGATHIGMMLNEVEYRLDIFILLFFLSPTEVGVYSIGVALAQILWYVTNSVNNVLFPEIASCCDKDKGRFVEKTLKFILVANLLIMILLVLGGYPFVRILYGIAFVGAYPVFLVLAPGLIADVISRTISSWLKGIGSPLLLSYVSVVSLIINIMLNCIFIPKFGILGAALSSAISYTLRAIVLTVIFCKKSGSTWRALFVFQKGEWGSFLTLLLNMIPEKWINFLSIKRNK